MDKILQSIESKIKKCENSKYTKSELERIESNIFQIAINLNEFELYEESKACFLRCLDIQRKLSNDQDNGKTLSTLKWIGSSLISLGKYDEAIKHFNELLPICNKLNPESKYSVLNGITKCLFQQEKFDEALNILKESNEIMKNTSLNETTQVTVLWNMGRVYEKKQMYVEALDFFSRSLEISQRIFTLGHIQLKRSLYFIGKMHYKLDDCDTALIYLKRALDEFGKSEVDSLIDDIKNTIGLAYKKLGNFEEAFKYLHEEKQKKENEEKVEVKEKEENIEEDDGFLLVDVMNEIKID